MATQLTTATRTNGSTPPPQPSRMSLAALVKGPQPKPLRVLLYGVEGIGKSTFASDAPAPIFLGAEDGTAHLDVTRFPMPTSWTEVLDAVRILTVEPHEFKTFALDTLDWAEPLLWAHICRRDGKKDIEDYGYGKGYQAALDEWRIFLGALERLREKRGMHIVLLAHSWIKTFKNPEGEDFDRYELKLHAKAGGLLKEWCDVVLFANYETFAAKDDKTKRVKGVSTGLRLIYTNRRAAYDAKNRFSLPESLPLTWNDFFTATAANRPAEPDALISAIRAATEKLGNDLKATAAKYLADAGSDAVKLSKILNWCNAKLAASGQEA